MTDINLRLPLTTKWFEMTRDGIKTEDYREITPYWAKRLVGSWKYKGLKLGQFPDIENSFMSDFEILSLGKSFTHNIMTLGYPKSDNTSRILRLEHKGIEIRTGNPEWGAEPNKLYFVIKHGEIIR
jgi:hypothetical protein